MENKMEHKTSLGKSELQVPRMGVGAMTWGDAKGLARLHPAKIAYGGADGIEEEKRAVESSVAAGGAFFYTTAVDSGGAAGRRFGGINPGPKVFFASKISGGFFFLKEGFFPGIGGRLVRFCGG